MPDLSTAGVADYWKHYPDSSIYRVVTFMESVETWTLDGYSTVESALEELSRELDDIKTINLEEFGEQELFMQVANSLKMGRALRFLQMIDQAHAGSASKLLMHAEQTTKRIDDLPGLFLRRNIVFERLRLLSRIFSPARINLVMKALEGEDHA